MTHSVLGRQHGAGTGLLEQGVGLAAQRTGAMGEDLQQPKRVTLHELPAEP